MRELPPSDAESPSESLKAQLQALYAQLQDLEQRYEALTLEKEALEGAKTTLERENTTLKQENSNLTREHKTLQTCIEDCVKALPSSKAYLKPQAQVSTDEESAGKEAQVSTDQEMERKEVERRIQDEKERDECTFFFVSADYILEQTDSLPRFQDLQRRGALVEKTLQVGKAYRSEYSGGDLLAVSHRWETPEAPDTLRKQLEHIKAHLKRHPRIRYVWYDFWCMPAGSSTASGPAADIEAAATAALVECGVVKHASTNEVYEEFITAATAREAAKEGAALGMSTQRFCFVTTRWSERLAVEMASLEVTRVFIDDDSVASIADLFSGEDNKAIQRAAPFNINGELASWVHLTIGEYLACRQCCTILDDMSFFHHELGAGESTLVDAVVSLITSLLHDDFRKDQRERRGGGGNDDNDSGGIDSLNRVEFTQWVRDTDRHAVEVLKSNRSKAIKMLRENAVDGVFKPSEAANALQELLRQLLAASQIGINRFRLRNLPQVERFLVEAVSEEPRRRSALVAIVKLGMCHAPLAPALEGAVMLLDHELLPKKDEKKDEILQSTMGSSSTSAGGLQTLGRSRLHAIASRPRRDGEADKDATQLAQIASFKGSKAINKADSFGCAQLDCASPCSGERVHPAGGRCTVPVGTDLSSHATTPARRAMRSRGGGPWQRALSSPAQVAPSQTQMQVKSTEQAPTSHSGSKDASSSKLDLDMDVRNALSILDNRVVEVLQAGHIRLVRSSWVLQQPDDYRIERRQELERYKDASPLLSPDEAVALIRKGTRSAGVLSYGCAFCLFALLVQPPKPSRR